MAKKTYEICEIVGDGIGPEIMSAAKEVLKTVQDSLGFKLRYHLAPCGDKVKEETGTTIPEESVEIFKRCDAALKGPIGDNVRDFVVGFRQRYDLYANVRPAISYPSISPPALRPDINLVVIRENSEGLYKSIENEVTDGVWTATGVYTIKACERFAKFSFEYAKKRLEKGVGKGYVVVATKKNIFRRTHGMFYEAFRKVSENYPDIRFDHYYADAMCAYFVRRPQDFDVVASENLLADLLSDLAGEVAGGLGMTAGTNTNPETKMGLFEPTHGSAPDIVGTGKANPIGQIRSAALMLEFLGTVHGDNKCLAGSMLIEKAIERLLTGEKKENLPIELGGKSKTDDVAHRTAGYAGGQSAGQK
ncbi:MAG: isocitrate/isopropylmalate family dehydrogenase [Candidatus Atabeyarchaeum deiterrae]